MQGLLDHYRATQTRPATLKRFITGGARCPERVIEEFEDVLGVEVAHAWGMTELSPVGTMNMPRRNPAWQSPEERNAFKVRQGRPALGVDLRLLGDDGKPVRHDGKTPGHLCVKGWAAAARYYGEDNLALDADGYFDTGDIATIDREGFTAITDRAKDLVKSGGEWISSQEIERHTVSHPAVAMAAVIGVPHHKWGERPILIVQRSQGAKVTADEIRAHLAGKIATWWMPDEIAFRNEMPLNATGKIDKKALRSQLCAGILPRTTDTPIQEAAFWVRKADLEKNPIYHFVAAAIYGQLGDATAAERERQWILAKAPGLLRDIHRELQMRIKAPRDQEHFLDGLKRAGFSLPES
jgi:fatty-acyl-CoA synthase